MPVSDDPAFELLRAFGRLEYQLKRRHDFLRADRHGNAMVNWKAVNNRVAALQPGNFVDRLSEATRRKVLDGARDRPKVQEVEVQNGVRRALFHSQPLLRPDTEPSAAAALIEAARRVRNNLFHGGKEDPGEQPFDGDDDEWAAAALDIASQLLLLVDEDRFGPPSH